ncbi:TPA: DegT/DnrJ/EryC1/StrS family aminotransferase [Candidatus Poribacteria bacterium]|nr:DegT/DnrJ/EryC1/StrS family aminotransferase [Candidatus Poribacteria bacterium]
MKLSNRKRDKVIPLCRPWIGEAEIEAVAEVLKLGWLSTGPKTAEFERRFAEYIGVKHALAVSSCTAGLHLALIAAGVGSGDEVITTPYTFTATSEVIAYTGARPVFADIDARTLNILPEDIEKRVTKATKAIIPVDIAGLPCEQESIIQIANRHNLCIIDDAAHAVSAEYRGVKIGAIADMSSFSFYATKNLTTAEGGMVTTDNDDFANQIRLIHYHARDKDAWARQQSQNRWYYDVTAQGYKYNMSDIQAALGLCQLAKIEKQYERRIKIVDRYNKAFEEMPEIVIPKDIEDGKHAWHLYIIQLNTERLNITRDEFINAMLEENVECGVHYIPLHFHMFYQQKYGYKKGDFPNAEKAYERVATLPLHPNLTEDDADYVIEAVKRVIC